MAEYFELLESNCPQHIDTAKQKFHEQFNIVKEPWLVNGLYDYYLKTNSVPSMEILINVREPHHNHLFDKLSDSIRGSKNDNKVQALTLLGHLVRKHPTWLHRITQHQVFKDILKLLRFETDILPLLSALLVLVVLLPYIPSLMTVHLQDVFEIFSRLAAWNCNSVTKLVEEQLVHMQVGLYVLFQRLYGMYPCNYLTYLRVHYKNKDLSPIFTHTIKPMLQTVIMHPLLVTTSKDSETSTERWMKMSPHDVVTECERYSLDLNDRFAHDTCLVPSSFRSRSGTMNSATFDAPYQFLRSMPPTVNQLHECDMFSPTQMILQSQTPPVNEATVATAIPHSLMQLTQGTGQGSVSQEGTSPPEAAIEATPETTPIKDTRMLTRQQNTTAVARALTSFAGRNRSLGSTNTTPTHSQPSSPMRKDVSSFNFPSDNLRYTSAFGLPKRDSHTTLKLQKLMKDRSQISDGSTEIATKPKLLPPISPLRIIPTTASADNSIPSSPLPLQRIDSPVSQEDEEVLAIVKQGEFTKHPGLRQCDSVLHDSDVCKTNDEENEDYSSGGLHMLNSQNIRSFRNTMKRLRYHSQCGPDGEQFDLSTGSSPGHVVEPTTNMTVRRANSCPEMKKSVTVTMDNITRTLEENEEENNQEERPLNGIECDAKQERCKNLATSETQTENFWPMPYEHLFLSIFPGLENTEVKPTPAPSPAPYNMQHEKYTPTSVYDILDRNVDIAVQMNDKDSIKYLKDQIYLLQQQLLFERHRREMHALRNRSLFTDMTKNRVLEEHNSALTDQVKLQEADIDSLKDQIGLARRDWYCKEKRALENSQYWETKYKELLKESIALKEKNENLQILLDSSSSKVYELDKKWQEAEACILDAEAEVKIAKEHVLAGEKGRIELELVNKELLLAGEVIYKYRERLSDLSLLRKSEQERTRLVEVYEEEIKNLHLQILSKHTAIDSLRTRISELEHHLLASDESCSVQKKVQNEVKDECHEKLKAVESKYQTQLSINRTMEGTILELYQQIELSGRRAVHSPDTSSCHEVNATLTDKTSTAPGLSPHSSPLSASLASSEGSSMAFLHTEMRNLQQIIVDQRDNPHEMRSSGTIESELNQEALGGGAPPSTSKTD